MNKNRCVVVAGAPMEDYAYASSLLKESDFMIYADCGLKHWGKLGKRPDLIVGDFDSFSNPQLQTETIVLPREKDDTDSLYAVKEGIRRGFTEFLILGAIGGRLDHTLVNVYLLEFLQEKGCHGVVVDDWSEMEIVGKDPVYIEEEYPYFSLINISGVAKDITIRNAKYPLEKGEIQPSFQYGISNEVIPLTKAEVSVGIGSLLLLKDRKG